MAQKYYFTFYNINIKNVEERFNLLISNINKKQLSNIPNNTTIINKLKDKNMIFLDEANKTHTCVISMIDFKTRKIVTNNNYKCFWCREFIETTIIPIGCPIKYVPNKLVKTYYSDITKDKYIITKNITKNTTIDIDDNTLDIINKNYYITDGIFCSFNCCGAYINSNKHNSLYNMSYTLLLNMYNTMYSNNSVFKNAPHWRTLKEYGGNLTYTQFKNSFDKIEYKHYGINIPEFHSTETLFEEILKF